MLLQSNQKHFTYRVFLTKIIIKHRGTPSKSFSYLKGLVLQYISYLMLVFNMLLESQPIKKHFFRANFTNKCIFGFIMFQGHVPFQFMPIIDLFMTKSTQYLSMRLSHMIPKSHKGSKFLSTVFTLKILTFHMNNLNMTFQVHCGGIGLLTAFIATPISFAFMNCFNVFPQILFARID